MVFCRFGLEPVLETSFDTQVGVKTMVKLSLNKAAKEAAVAKATLLDALKSGRISALRNEKGHWEIDPAELFRVFPRTGVQGVAEPIATPVQNQVKTIYNGALEVEVKMLREQISRMDDEREREREQLGGQIQDLRQQLERQSLEHRQALALLTDQRDAVQSPTKAGFWARILGK